MNILDTILETSKQLDLLDDFGDKMNENLSYYDSKVSDLYHLLEDMTLDSKKCYRYCKELKSVLNERRICKQNISIYRKYKDNVQKLINGRENRGILLSILGKEDKNTKTPYRNRIYTDEELKELIGV